MRKKYQKYYQTLKIFSSLLSLTRHFTKFIFLEQLTAMLQFNMQNMLFCVFYLFIFFFFLVVVVFFFFFFLSSHHDTNPYFICIIFARKSIIIYIYSELSRIIFSFFVFIQWVKHFCTPANFVTI